MALYVRQDQQRSEIQNKVADGLQQRLKDEKKIEAAKTDPTFMDDKVQTSGIGIVALLVGLVIAGLAIYLL